MQTNGLSTMSQKLDIVSYSLSYINTTESQSKCETQFYRSLSPEDHRGHGMASNTGGWQRGEPGGVRRSGDVGVPPERRPEVLHAQHGPRHRGQLLRVDRRLRPPLATRLLR